MKKEKKLIILIAVLALAIIGTLIYGYYCRQKLSEEAYSDGIEQIDLDTIYLTNSGVKVSFSDVILGKDEEVRKLIVSTKEVTVSTKLTDSLIKKLEFDIWTKTQKVSYTGTGYFVVDLDGLTKNDVIQDNVNKTITIRIDHAYLQTIEIDPEKIIIDEVEESLLARGDIKLTVSDYTSIEKELIACMNEKLDTAEHGQEADAIALRMVKEIYEPLVKAVDSGYELEVEFK